MKSAQLATYYKIILLALFCLFSLPVSALSLGKIELKSSFGEPFLAEISLPSYSDEEIGSMQINLASNKQHEAMGYAITETTKRFRFAIKENSEGIFYIQVRSQVSIKELSVSLLIEIISSSGRIIKGYDILLTPKAILKNSQNKEPSKSTTPTKLITKKTIPPTINEITSPVKLSNVPDKKPIKKSFVRKLPNGGLEYVNVGSGVTLSSIANAMRSDNATHINQVIAALHKQNPNAFINGNINRLKMGVNLKLLAVADIAKMSQVDAINYIQQKSQKAKQRDLISKRKSAPLKNQLTKSTKKEFLSAVVKDQLHEKEIKSIKSELDVAQQLTKELEGRNENLIVMISKLELEIKKMTQSLMQKPEDIIAKAKINDPLIVRTRPERTKSEPSFLTQLENNLIPAIVASIAVILMTVLIVKKRENIKSYIENYKAKKDRNIFN